VLAISSGGGHWVQMLRLLPAFAGHQMVFVTVSRAYRCDVRGAKFYAVVDATAWDKVKLCGQALQILLIVLRERPDTVISTGAAPGYFALRFAKLLGCHTVWIDSIANVECLSMSGRQVAEYADLWLTQWPHLALDSGPQFRGAVL
jgi:UDP-N-acetylglucosamine:LPS N-acetylglucosamine transferase